MGNIRILLVDDMPEITDYFNMVLGTVPDLEVVGIANSGKMAVELHKDLRPDVVLMDMQMESKYAGIEAIKTIKAVDDEVKIIVLTIHKEDEILFKAYSAGAMDFIDKTSSIINIIEAVRRVSQNQLMLRPEISEKIMKEFIRLRESRGVFYDVIEAVSKLTNSEFEIIFFIHEGLTYKKIAAKRYVEESTIKSHVNKIIKKFDEKNMKSVIKKLKMIDFFENFKERL